MRKLNIALSAGHNVYYGRRFDVGAVGNGLRESDITKSTVKYLKPILEDMGHSVYDVTPYNGKFINSTSAHRNRAKKVNKLDDDVGIDIYLDVHINAGGGTGPEVLLNAKNVISKKYGEGIVNAISDKTGLRSRGIKDKPNFMSIRMVKPPAIIVEGGFIDSPGNKDMQVLNPKLYAESIASVFGVVKESEKYMILNKDIIIDGNDCKLEQIVQDGITYVSLRQFSDALGMEVNWNEEERVAEVNPKEISILIDGEVRSVKGNKIGGTNYGEIREIAESLGKEVSWDRNNRIIVIE